MSKYLKEQENWTGLTFGNNWIILKKYSCAEYRKIYEELTGDKTKQIKNAHYLVQNNNCKVQTYMERTVIDRALKNKTPVMSKCKGCLNKSRLHNNCYYEEMCRIKNLNKIPDRTSKIEVGEIYGNFLVRSIRSSENFADHQCRAIVNCLYCGAEQESRFDKILKCELSCECFRNHSNGERVIQAYLDEHHILYKSEYTFENLYGLNGGQLRYDFCVLNENKPIALIEFDGEQHSEIGTFYNPDGIVQKHDKIKDDFAKKYNIPLLRISYKDILKIYSILNDFFKDLK